MPFPIFDILSRRAELSPDTLAMRELDTGVQVTYRDLDQRAARAATLMAGTGIEQGDRVAVLCRNRIEFFELLFGCARLGAVLVPLNWRMPVSELCGLVADSGPKLLFFGQEDAAAAAELGSDVTLGPALDDGGETGYHERRNRVRTHPGRGAWSVDDIWYLLYTSGTTGRPKAVIQTVGMALANHINISQGMGLRGSDTTLNYLPLFHSAGINLTTLPALIDGATVLIMPSFDVDALVGLIEARTLNTFFGVPAIYQALSLHPRFDTLPLDSVRSWGCGGAPLPDVLIETFAQRGALVLNGMGMTETGPTVFLMDQRAARSKIGSVGKPQLLSAARIVDADGNDVEQGDSGELWFAGPGMTPGYWRNEEATVATFSADGWLRSGDLGRQDEDGYYYIVGRLKDMFISGGENVYPAEVENQLATHPDILEAAVVGVSDPKWGEVGRAYLLPRPDHQLPSADDLRGYCRERMAAYKVPQSFVAVEDFPRTAAGKIQKHLLI